MILGTVGCSSYGAIARTKRTACRALVPLALLSSLTACRGEASAREGNTGAVHVVVAVIAPAGEAGESTVRGTTLGAEEAARTGALLGSAFTVRTVRVSSAREARAAATRLLDEGAMALVGGFDDSSCTDLAALAAHRDAVHVNVTCPADVLRAVDSHRAFHVAASDSMHLAAVASMRGGGDAPVLWHAALARYGAGQLNQRFLRRFGQPADAGAWAGWMAVKVLAQAARETTNPTPARLTAHLIAREDGFDGHKGEPLRFDPATRQLRQPLFPAPRGVPARDRDGDGTSRALGEATRLERDALSRAVRARESLLVVSNEGSANVMVLRLPDGEVLATIAFAERPRGIQVGGDGERIYVALSDESPTEEGDGDAIAELDLRTGRVIQRHPAGSDPEQFAVTRDGALLIAANEDAGTATITDRNGGTAPVTLVVGIEPEGVALSPDGRWAYITAETSNTVTVIDVHAREVVRSFLVDERPRAAAFAPDGARAYVTNEISGTLTAIDAHSHEPIATLRLAGGAARPVGVVVSPDSRTIYVANGRANSISIIDAESFEERRVIATGGRPWGIALSADGCWLYTANGGTNDVSVIDTRHGRVVGTIPVGERPWGVVVNR